MPVELFWALHRRLGRVRRLAITSIVFIAALTFWMYLKTHSEQFSETTLKMGWALAPGLVLGTYVFSLLTIFSRMFIPESKSVRREYKRFLDWEKRFIKLIGKRPLECRHIDTARQEAEGLILIDMEKALHTTDDAKRKKLKAQIRVKYDVVAERLPLVSYARLYDRLEEDHTLTPKGDKILAGLKEL